MERTRGMMSACHEINLCLERLEANGVMISAGDLRTQAIVALQALVCF